MMPMRAIAEPMMENLANRCQRISSWPTGMWPASHHLLPNSRQLVNHKESNGAQHQVHESHPKDVWRRFTILIDLGKDWWDQTAACNLSSIHRRPVTITRPLTSDAARERCPNGKNGTQEVHGQPVLFVELVWCPSHGFLPSIISLTMIKVSMPELFSPYWIGYVLQVGHIDLVFVIRHDGRGEAIVVWSRIEGGKGMWDAQCCQYA
jgi:hypothetical protein